jgi:molecular chaperone HscB
LDPFATLGLPRTFDVDLASAERSHRELSRALHPDRYVGSIATERRQALSRAVEVNEAWRVVRDPVRRAEALLALRGVDVAEDARGAPADPDFLMEMLERREALGEARRTRDLGAVRGMAGEMAKRVRDAEAALSQDLARGDDAEALRVLSELKFFRRFLDEVSTIEDELAA